ncbi:SDR family oxidoreductase [Halosimplex aquaticum]|uniref:SDR family oxidoreductase n=1 Tax=Halosimplex aquaticum TaxID=3026162 RepID=A0ABD5XVU9_9EURY|nr:NAD(P)H-binding protein [Halosimplex aquaticum]
MTTILVTGATGTLGRPLRSRLAEAGETVRAASRSPPDETDDASERRDAVEWVELDLADGTGLERAVGGVDVVVHAATAPQGDSEAVDVDGTERLLDAAESAGVDHVVYPSIVGIEAVPYSYYRHKLAAERAVEASEVPATILRATQFHQFVDQILGMAARVPVWPLPTTFRVQPVDAGEVADALVDCAIGEPRGRVPPVGGPEVRTLGELAVAYREARGLRRPIVRLPLPGAVASAFRAGEATCPDRAVGTVTWEEWLAAEYGGATESARPDAAPS